MGEDSYKIMIVDDATVIRKNLKYLFEELGHKIVHEATNGVDAISKYESCKPDVITMDISMPRLDGLQTVKKMTEKYPNAIIIMITALAQKQNVYDAIKAGARDFIVKPVESRELKKVLDKLKGELNK